MLTIKPVFEAIPAKTLQSTQDQAGRIFKAMSPGRILTVEVVQGGQGNTLLKWGNFQFRAESRIPLCEGQKLTLLVTENSSQIKLKNLGSSSQPLRFCWPLLTEKNLLPRLLDAVLAQPHLLGKPLDAETVKNLELFRTLQDSSEELDLEQVKQFLRMLGMKFSSLDEGGGRDAQGKTLKSCLQELLAGLKEPGSDLGKKLEAVLGGLGKANMEGQDGKTADVGFVFLPLPFLEKGFLVFEKPGGESGNEKKSPWLLSLFLETGALGELQIDFLEHDHGLLLKFIAESQEVKRFLEACGDDFRKYFSALPLRSLTFETAPVPPGNSLLKRIAGGNKGVLETWV